MKPMDGKTLTKSGKGDGVDTEFLRYNVAYYSCKITRKRMMRFIKLTKII